MNKNLIQKMNDNYNEENLKELDKHIEESSQKQTQQVYGMVQKHNGPTEIKTSKKGMKKLAKTILDL